MPTTRLAHMAPFRDSWFRLARRGLDPKAQALLMARQRQIGAPEGLVSFHGPGIIGA